VTFASTPEPPARRTYLHGILAVSALALWVVALTPPLLALTGEYEFVQGIQYCLFAIAIPCLVVVARPWRWLGFTSSEVRGADQGHEMPTSRQRRLDRWAQVRSARHGYRRSVTYLCLFIGQSILWRSAPVVDALIRHPWLSVFESVALVVGGVFLWLELVDSPPFRPTIARPYRLGMAAIALWTQWVIAYLMALDKNPWYSGFRHVSGRLLTLAADQQLTTALVWFITATAFVPVVFSNLLRWLKSEDDPDEELYQLVRRERSRGFFGTNP
jgi:cytochrome c oxidase assembly factor CtaG